MALVEVNQVGIATDHRRTGGGRGAGGAYRYRGGFYSGSTEYIHELRMGQVLCCSLPIPLRPCSVLVWTSLDTGRVPPEAFPGLIRHAGDTASECIENNGLEDAAKLAFCICIKFDSQK